MLAIWRNPEYLRHVRGELRFSRAVTVAVVVLLVCFLVGLACWAGQQAELENARNAAAQFGGQWQTRLPEIERQAMQNFWRLCYRWLIGMQGTVLIFWSLFACAQSVSGERDRKTWDFQRTTRLGSGELLVGKLLGEPILAYFMVMCTVPITFVAGLGAGIPIATIVAVYVILFSTGLFVGLWGLWLSTLLESKNRGMTMIGALALLGMTVGTMGFQTSPFPGMAALSPLTGILAMVGDDSFRRQLHGTMFGHEWPWVALTAILHACFGAWIALMLVRNLKRDYEEIRPLSRWQAVGCAGFLNLLAYACLNPKGEYAGPALDVSMLASGMVALNGPILMAVGLSTLTPAERLRVWWRRRNQEGLLSENGLPWPWLLVAAAVAYVLMICGLLAWKNSVPFETRALVTSGIQLLVLLSFVVRDILFVQWCKLTRMRQPVLKALLLLGLYYAASIVISIVFGLQSHDVVEHTLAWLTPFMAFNVNADGIRFAGSVYGGAALQVGITALLAMAISSRLGRPAAVPVKAAAEA
jgi:ABC-2 type transporter